MQGRAGQGREEKSAVLPGPGQAEAGGGPRMAAGLLARPEQSRTSLRRGVAWGGVGCRGAAILSLLGQIAASRILVNGFRKIAITPKLKLMLEGFAYRLYRLFAAVSIFVRYFVVNVRTFGE